MPKKKSVKLRGSRTQGYGSAKKNRGKGNRGGKGMAGTKDHRKFSVAKYFPGHIGKHGFRSLSKRGLKPRPAAINLRDLEKLVEESKSKEIDLPKLGYDRVLGAGTISKPLAIKAFSFSKTAEEKIKKAGGTAVKM
jgi:large subunit ribosomal protein L15